MIGSVVTDVIGQFSLLVRLPGIPENNKNEVEVRAADQSHSAWIDFL